ncbi:MAG: glycosyltransferase [Caldilineales bacterium]
MPRSASSPASTSPWTTASSTARRAACSAGYDVTLIAVHDRAEVKDGVRIVPLPRVQRWQRPLLWRELLRLARAEDAGLYLFHDPELLLPTPLLRLQTGKPTVYDVHEANADFIAVKDYMPAVLRYPAAWAFGWLEPRLARLQSGLIFADDQIALDFAAIDMPKTTLFNFPSMEFVERASALTPTLSSGRGGRNRRRRRWCCTWAGWSATAGRG